MVVKDIPENRRKLLQNEIDSEEHGYRIESPKMDASEIRDGVAGHTWIGAAEKKGPR